MSAIASGKEDLSSDDENKNFKVSQVAFNDKVVKEDPNPSFEHRIVQIQVNLCQKLFFLQNMGRTCCVQKLFWTSETISVHNMFSPGFHVLNR